MCKKKLDPEITKVSTVLIDLILSAVSKPRNRFDCHSKIHKEQKHKQDGGERFKNVLPEGLVGEEPLHGRESPMIG